MPRLPLSFDPSRGPWGSQSLPPAIVAFFKLVSLKVQSIYSRYRGHYVYQPEQQLNMAKFIWKSPKCSLGFFMWVFLLQISHPTLQEWSTYPLPAGTVESMILSLTARCSARPWNVGPFSRGEYYVAFQSSIFSGVSCLIFMSILQWPLPGLRLLLGILCYFKLTHLVCGVDISSEE